MVLDTAACSPTELFRLLLQRPATMNDERTWGGSASRSRLHNRADLAHGLAGQAQLREIPSLRTEVAPELVEVSVMRPSMTGVATPAARPSSDMATSPHGTSSITYLCCNDGGVGVH